MGVSSSKGPGTPFSPEPWCSSEFRTVSKYLQFVLKFYIYIILLLGSQPAFQRLSYS